MMSSKTGIPWPTGAGPRFAAGTGLGAWGTAGSVRGVAGCGVEPLPECKEDEPACGAIAIGCMAALVALVSAAKLNGSAKPTRAATSATRMIRRQMPG